MQGMDQRFNLERNSFEQIIAAASLLQQIQRQTKCLSPGVDSDTSCLNHFANVQQEIQSGVLSPKEVISRVAAPALDLLPAQGASVWLFEGDTLAWCASAGTVTLDTRLRDAIFSRLPASAQPPDLYLEALGSYVSLFRSLLVAPIHQESKIIGALAVSSDLQNAFSERDETSARLLTGLLTQALDKAADARFKHVVGLERAAVLHVIETVVPSLEEMLGTHRQEVRSSGAVSVPGSIPNSGFYEVPESAFWRDKESTTFVPEAISEVSPSQVPRSRIENSSVLDPATREPVEVMKITAAELQASSASTQAPPTETNVAQEDPSLWVRHIIPRLRQQWRILHDRSLNLAANILAEARRYRSAISFDPHFFSKELKPIVAVIAVVMAATVLLLRPHVSPAKPIAPAPQTQSHQSPKGSEVESPTVDGSHKRVTDLSTAEALGELSRFEIPGLLRQARFGDDSAAFTLGMAYETGHGVPQNCTKATHWVQEAAQGGNAAAEYNLSLRYRQGDGVKTDLRESEKWMRKAAARNYAEAVKQLGAHAPIAAQANLLTP